MAVSSLNPRFRHFFCTNESPEWKALHNPEQRRQYKFYSASVIPDLCGSSIGYNSRSQQYDWIKGLKEQRDISDLPPIKFGNENEPIAKERFQECFPFLMCVTPGLLYHPEYEYIGATSDLLAISKQNGELLNVEIKCMFMGILPETVEDIKARYIIQTMVQMAVSNIPVTALWYWTQEQQACFLIPFHKGLWEELLRVVHEFDGQLQRNERPTRTSASKNLLQYLQEVKSTIKKVL